MTSMQHGVTYPCDQCAYEATHMSNLNQHIKSVHSDVKYSCKQCDYQAKWPVLLRKHVKDKHLN